MRLIFHENNATDVQHLRSLRKKQTSFDEFAAFVDEIGGHVVVADELLKADHVKASVSEVEVRGDRQQYDAHREVYVESIADDRDDVHVAHNL